MDFLMTVVSAAAALLILAGAVLCMIQSVGAVITVISLIRRKKAAEQGRKPHKAGLIIGIVLMGVPALIAVGIVLYLVFA